MTKFYTSVNSEFSHVEEIAVVKHLIESIQKMVHEPASNLLSANRDFFGDKLDVDATLTKLRHLPSNPMFNDMTNGCLQAITDVLEHQYSRYFSLDITEKLQEETASAQQYNADAEELMGMFSSSKKKNPRTEHPPGFHARCLLMEEALHNKPCTCTPSCIPQNYTVIKYICLTSGTKYTKK